MTASRSSSAGRSSAPGTRPKTPFTGRGSLTDSRCGIALPQIPPDPSPDAALKQVDGLHDVPRPHLAGLRRRARRVSSMIRSELRRSARGSDVRETSSDRVRASISLYIGYIVEPPFKEDLEDFEGSWAD